MGSDSLIIDVLSIFFEGWCFKWVDTKVLSGGLLTRWVADLELVNSFYVSKLWTTIIRGNLRSKMGLLRKIVK